MNKSIPQIDYTGVEYPPNTRIRHKIQSVNQSRFKNFGALDATL